MANKVGPMIKEARTAAGFTQEQLAKKLAGISANDISKFERGEVVPTQTVLKEIAKLTGVTQSSLINAAKESSTTKTTSTKTTTKSTAAKSTASKSSTAKKTTASSSSTTSEKLTATEKKVLDLYRAANSDTKKAAVRVLKGECNDMLTSILGNGSGVSGVVEDLLTGMIGNLLGGGK